jgi:hypothetical protein
MGRAKEIIVKVIPSKIANEFVKRNHYSGKVVPNSQLHFGAFLDGRLHGVLSYGPSTDKSKIITLVEDTGWNEFIELNRMAFDDYLPRNAESYCIAKTLKLIKKNAPQIKWVISFADGCQCGDGTIYRASNFILTGIKKNTGMRIDENGNVYSQVTFSAHKPNEMDKFRKMKVLEGYQFRYIYFIDKKARKKLTVEEVPFSEIDKLGAGMYKGKKIEIKERHIDNYCIEAK